MKSKVVNPHAKEAKAKWGDTKSYQESVDRVEAMGPAKLQQVLDEADRITQAIAKLLDKSPSDSKVIKLIAKHRDNLSNFYTVTDEIYTGLAKMYLEDPRFRDHYESICPGL